MGHTPQIEQLLVEVQTQLAFQEDTIAALNAAVTRQQQDLTLLRRQLELLKHRQDEQANALQDLPAAAERPPHY